MRRGIVRLLTALYISALLGASFAVPVSAASKLPQEVNVYVPQAGWNTSLITTLENKVGIKFYSAKWYLDWSTDFTSEVPVAFDQKGLVPELTWEPKLGSESFPYTDVTSGRFDSYLTNFANAVKNFGKPIRIVLAPEMNTTWTPWGTHIAGNTDTTHKEFWKYTVDKFRAAGATNAAWVWAPNIIPADEKYTFAQMYPGDAYVDFVGLEGYNWGTSRSWSVWQSFDEVFGPSYNALTAVTSKQILITEIGSTELGGSKADWLKNMGQSLRTKYPRVKGFTWFNINKETDWRIESSDASVSAFRVMVLGEETSAPPASTGSTSSSSSVQTSPKTQPKTIPKVTSNSAAPAPVVEDTSLPLTPQITGDLPEPISKAPKIFDANHPLVAGTTTSSPLNPALFMIWFCTGLLVSLGFYYSGKHAHRHVRVHIHRHRHHHRVQDLHVRLNQVKHQLDSIRSHYL